MLEKLSFLNSLIPRFLRNFIDGNRGDFNDHPEARSFTWPAFFVGLLSLGLAVYAAHLGYPIYVELTEDTAYPELFALILIFIISGTIYTCSQIVGMYIVEKRKHGVSRTDGGRIQWVALLLIFLVAYDLSMNHGGQMMRLLHSKTEDVTQATSKKFVFDRQEEFDALTKDIWTLGHPKHEKVGCKGNLACKTTCPVHKDGCAHNASGTLTKYGDELVDIKTAALAKIQTERDTALAHFNLGTNSELAQANSKNETKTRVSVSTVFGLYLVMFISCIVGAALDLAFEDAAGIALDYNKLAEFQLRRAEQQRDDKERRTAEAKARKNERRMKEQEAALQRRNRRRNTLKPGEYSANPSPTPPIPTPGVGATAPDPNKRLADIETLLANFLQQQQENSKPVNGTSIKNERVPIGFERTETPKTVTVETISNGYRIVCQHCGTEAVKKSSFAKFCSNGCRNQYHKESKS